MIQFHDGDLIFLDLKEGDLSEAISDVTKRQFRVEGPSLSHVGVLVYEKNGWKVYEAWKVVTKTPLHEFIARGKAWHQLRLSSKFNPLIPHAIKILEDRLGRVYDHDFTGENGHHYCSHLVADVFQEANGGNPIFEFSPMYFGEPNDPTDLSWKTWEAHFKKRKCEVPIGKPGISPLGIYLQIRGIHEFKS